MEHKNRKRRHPERDRHQSSKRRTHGSPPAGDVDCNNGDDDGRGSSDPFHVTSGSRNTAYSTRPSARLGNLIV